MHNVDIEGSTTIQLHSEECDTAAPKDSILLQQRDPTYDLLQMEQFRVVEQDVEIQHRFREKFEALKERTQLELHESAAMVLKYWSGVAAQDELMGKIAKVVFGAAPTQVSVERSFSTMRWVLSDLRNRLGEDRLEEILLLKLNS